MAGGPGIAWDGSRRLIAALAIGSPGYAINVVRHGNRCGRWWISGRCTCPAPCILNTALLQSGRRLVSRRPVAAAARAIVDDDLAAVPAFDMRIGGLGLLFLVALPFAIVRAVDQIGCGVGLSRGNSRRRTLRWRGMCAGVRRAGAGIRGPGLLVRCGRSGRLAVFGLAALFAGQGTVGGYPGLRRGPPLSAYPHMTDVQRRSAVGAVGPPGAFVDLMDSLRPGRSRCSDRLCELLIQPAAT